MDDIYLTQKQVVDIENCSEKTIQRRINSGYYKKVSQVPAPNGGGKNGVITKIALSCLSPDAQKRYVTEHDVSPLLISSLAPEAAIEVANKYLPDMSMSSASTGGSDAWSGNTAININILHDEGVQKSSRIVQEALNVPRGWKKREWIEAVALKHDTTISTIYRKIQKYEKGGLAGLKHSKPKQAKTWTPEAIDWWVGLCLKKEHRKLAKDGKKKLYAILQEEATKRGWDIGGYESALWWLKKRVTPQLLALQRGGVRALDNTLPPVLRNYSDLAPFEILVGDQHRFDFWVVDDDTGEVFRPEGYFWQDLRTRCFYGGAVDRKYDSQLMGLALRIGVKIFGAFGSIYTDHGKPEESKYIQSIMKDIRSLHMSAENVIDIPACSVDIDPEEINPCVIIPGMHRKAIVRNAKAKMIEGTFSIFEQLLRNTFMVPGYVKRLTASQEEQEVDQKEIEKLAKAGKLLTFSEFRVILYKAMDFYNKTKAHRGVRKEWVWRPKPREITPMDCLKMCCQDGWQPTYLNNDTTDLIFLARDARSVDRGRITFRNELYEHDALIPINLEKGEKVEIRYDPMDPEWLLVFTKGEYLCQAELVEYSSMKNKGIAEKKIEEKARRRKECIAEYRQLTSNIPDFIQHSKISSVEKAAALIGRDKKKRADEQYELNREWTDEELKAEMAELEAQAEKSKNNIRIKPLPVRPTYFLNDLTRYTFCVDYEIAGGELNESDQAFKLDYENRMTEGQREYWEMVRKYGTYS
ncbi:MAG: Mu transposase C-terminal domain-containing protein [Pseudomonadota bacterium]